MRCLMAVWSSHRGMTAGNTDESGPLPPYCSTNTALAQWWMKQAGALFMGPESTLPVCLHTAQWMPLQGGGKEKDDWHWNELLTCNSCGGAAKLSEFVIWTFQRWKPVEPPELSWDSLLFQSCSSLDTGCWSRASEGYLVDRKGSMWWLEAEQNTHMWLLNTKSWRWILFSWNSGAGSSLKHSISCHRSINV